MNTYPEKVKLSPNRGGTIKPKYIILHHSSGSHDGTLDWISQRRSRVSYHYLIDSDGSRTQMVWDSKRAWHTGKSRWGSDRNLNGLSVGISFWGDTYERKPGFGEIESCSEKCIYLMEKFNIPIENILTHQEVAPDRKNDCSPITKERVITSVKARLIILEAMK